MDQISGISIFRKTTEALCRFRGTIAQSRLPQHSQWIGSGVSVHTFLYHAGFKSVQLEQFPFLPFQRQLGSQVWLHWHCTDHGAIPVRCHPFGSLVGSSGTSKVSHGGDLSSAPWLGSCKVWSFGNINFTKLIELWLCRSTVSYLWCVQVTDQK